MMGYHPPPNDPLFSYNVQLETRVRKDHPLRKIKELIDFDFIYKEVEKTYGTNGNVSVPPPVMLKLMLLLVLYNVRSERELMDTLPERLDWLWFLGFTMESSAPDHSVLSKARRRWGEAAFKRFFERIVVQCVNAGLVDGTRIFMDSSLIDAHASNNSVVDAHSLKRYLKEGYRELARRLTSFEGVNGRYVSVTDPDASIVRHAGGKAKLRYKTHRAVDPLNEVITAVKVTPGAVNEGYEMGSLIEAHETAVATTVKTVIADSQYGTGDNLLLCYDREIRAHVPVIKHLNEQTSSRQGIFPEDRFTYDTESNTYRCPAGKVLKKRTFHPKRQTTEYAASKRDCQSCSLRDQCTRDKNGRSVQRHVRKKDLDSMLAVAQTSQAKRDLKMRQHAMERSFARSTRFGFDRARWRGLWKMAIQEYLVSAIQNIETLIRYGRTPTKGVRSAPLAALERMIQTSISSFPSFWRRAILIIGPLGFVLPGTARHRVRLLQAHFGQQALKG
jgi:transposase